MSQRRYGTALSYVYIFINLMCGLMFTPFIVHHLGKSEYGLFAMMGSLIANLSILDLGLNDSVVRFVAKYRAHDDKAAEERLLGLMTMLYSGIAVLVILIGSILITRLHLMFPSLTPEQLHSASLMLGILMCNVAVTMFFNAISATVVAYESFVLLRTLEISAILISTLGIFIMLKLGYKAVAIVAVTASTNALVLFTKVFYAFFKLKVRLKFGKPDLGFLKEVFQYSGAIVVVVVVEQIYWKLDGIILGAMMNTAVVAVYTIGMSFSKYFMSFSTAISKVLMPKIVRRVEQGADATELTDVLISVSRIQAIVLMPILIVLIAFGSQFISLWVGPSFAPAYFVMLVTLIPYSLELIGNIRNQIMQAKGIYWYRSITILILASINVVTTIILIRAMGMVGAAVSTGVGIAVGYVVINRIIQVKLGIDVVRFARELWSGLSIAILLAGLVAGALYFVPTRSWGMLGVKVLAFGLVYVAAVWTLGMRETERQLIRSLVPERLKRSKVTA